MTQEEIIEMARQADLDWHTGWTLDDDQPNRFETFAKLVAKKEREACAQEAERTFYSVQAAENIRARGQE